MKSSERNICLVERNLDQAVSVLVKGGIVAFPTETYYGLAVNPFNTEALLKLFSIKKRSKNKAILLLIADTEQLNKLTDYIPQPYYPLIEKYWPGPLTLIFKANESVNDFITGGNGTIGVRISPHPLAQKLCLAWKNPITATSANLSGMPPAETSEEVYKYFGDSIDYILDGGSTPAGLCSTIIGIKNDKLKLIRKGQVEI